jgi:hypothetical protein
MTKKPWDLRTADRLNRWADKIENWTPLEDWIEQETGKRPSAIRLNLLLVGIIIVSLALMYGLLWALIGLSYLAG